MTGTNSELDRILEILWANLTGFWVGEGDFPDDEVLEEFPTIAEAKAAINQLLLKARRDEARHWDEHILGAPRKITVNDKAKDRIAELDTQIQEGTE